MTKRPADRYIKFNGDKIHSSRLQAFAESVGVKAMGISALIAGTLTTAFNHEAATTIGNTAIALMGGFVALSSYECLSEPRILRPFSEDVIETKAIDTAPDEKTPPSVDKYGPSATQSKNMALFYTIFNTVISVLAPKLILPDKPSSEAMLGAALTAAPFFVVSITESLSAWNRFNKISTGEWVVVDMPTPEKIAEMEEAYDRQRETTSLVPALEKF